MGVRDCEPRAMTCRKCDFEGPRTKFKKGRRVEGRRERLCRSCDYEASKAWRARNQERTREQLAEQYWRDPEKNRERARKKWHASPIEWRNATSLESKRRIKRGQAHWQRTSKGVLIGRMAAKKKDRTYVKERLAGKC